MAPPPARISHHASASVLALESAKRRVMHLAEGRTPVPIVDRQNDARHGGNETNETDLLTSRFREGSTIVRPPDP